MKKTISLLAVFCMAAAANATILRVNNNTGSSAPYTTIEAALEAAAEGDTIMLDASPVKYPALEIEKRVVLLGPGHWLAKNGIISEGAEAATIDGIKIHAEGAVVKSIAVPGGASITIQAHNVVVNRCQVNGQIVLRNASGSVIHQCYANGVEGYGSNYQENYIQVTNNILYGRISNLNNSYIAYNTLTSFFNLKDCTVEYNWATKDVFKGGNGNSFNNNISSEDYSKPFNNAGRYDGMFAAVEVDETLRSTYGAFAGDTPYVLSGVPAGPIVEDLVVPATVEKGSKLQVTIKVGIQQ